MNSLLLHVLVAHEMADLGDKSVVVAAVDQLDFLASVGQSSQRMAWGSQMDS
jgi:hypothetical protein